ncbi:flagellar biosynthesis repressor FlbT [Microvirga roseola]|uniref:flagellar biosynthesis repressor FlbT n=1 Tax=Microvirga roseola TaxID=2883126 RepID=UPI001E2ACE66|nr:flagellar biosynthesis repressor FlbT [Microvirga roseola]
MKAKMHFSLKAGERIFINGAVLTANQKVTLSLLNDARFLLESHVLQVAQATTPMRQLYFVVQALLIDPASAGETIEVFRKLHSVLLTLCEDEDIRDALNTVKEQVEADRTFDALKIIRGLFEVETAAPAVSADAAHQAA